MTADVMKHSETRAASLVDLDPRTDKIYHLTLVLAIVS